jgi:hypothetical protein
MARRACSCNLKHLMRLRISKRHGDRAKSLRNIPCECCTECTDYSIGGYGRQWEGLGRIRADGLIDDNKDLLAFSKVRASDQEAIIS